MTLPMIAQTAAARLNSREKIKLAFDVFIPSLPFEAYCENMIASDGEKVNENFGRQVSDESAKPHGGDVEGEVQYVSSVSFVFDQVIIYKLALIGALLALVSSAAAITFVLRYNPLEILAERD